MSAKYADLPDIDTAPDIYETEDVFPSSQADKGNSSDEESGLPTRPSTRGKNGDLAAGKEELDSSHLIRAEDASKKFRRAEKRHDRARMHYNYPDSPTSQSPSSASMSKPVPLSHRLRALQAELVSLEAELADPSNPQLHKEREEDNVDPGELIRGLVEVRGRLEKISKRKEGRGKLVSVILGDGRPAETMLEVNGKRTEDKKETDVKDKGKENHGVPDVRSIAEMDKRVGELETLVGSSSAALDEASPLPPPLLPLITRLNTQIQILTQPRHIDSISRRLKLLLSDLDRASASQHHSHRRPPPQQQNHSSSPLSDQLLPLLTRLGPSLPHIPHILTRLRTLSALHSAAGEFQGTLEGLEEDQRKMHDALGELEGAVDIVESSLEENRGLVKGNIGGLEQRVDGLMRRLEELSRRSETKYT